MTRGVEPHLIVASVGFAAIGATAVDAAPGEPLLRAIQEIATQGSFADIDAIASSLGIVVNEDTPAYYAAARARRFVPADTAVSPAREMIVISGDTPALRLFPAKSTCVKLSDLEQTFNIEAVPFEVPVSNHRRGPNGQLSITTSFVHGGFMTYVLTDAKRVAAVKVLGPDGGCARELQIGYWYGPQAEEFRKRALTAPPRSPPP